MYPYKFQLTSTQKYSAIENHILQLDGGNFHIQSKENGQFIIEKKQVQKNAKPKGYQIPVLIEAAIVTDLDTQTHTIYCQAKFTSAAMFRQLLISIILAGIIMVTWQQSSGLIKGMQWLCGIVIVGSFMSSWKALTVAANLFKNTLKKKLN